MDIKKKYGRILLVGRKSGVSVVRDGTEIRSVPGAGNKILSYFQYTQSEKSPDGTKRQSPGTAYNSAVSCGGRSGSSSNSFPEQPDRRLEFPTVSHRMGNVSTEEPPPGEGEVCDDVGLIIATLGGYYILITSDLKQDAILRYLGSSETDICIISNVGRVERFEHGYSSCILAKWDFSEGVRKISIANEYDLQTSTPFLWSEKTENFAGYYKDFVYTPHYGYIDHHQEYSIAGMAGCLLSLGVCFFHKDSIITAEYRKEFYLKGTIGWDSNNYGDSLSSIRIQKLDIPRACPAAPTLPSNDKIARLLEHTNHTRYCIGMVDELPELGGLTTLCQEYSNVMAENEFVNPVNIITGETLDERLERYDISKEYVFEFLSSIDDPEIELEEILIDVVCDNIFNGIVSDKDDFAQLVASKYFKIGFGVSQSTETDKWYYYILVLSQPGDITLVYPENSLYLPNTPEFVDTDVYINPTGIGNIYRAFSTIPKVVTEINCSCNSWWEGEVANLDVDVTIKDNGEYSLNSGTINFNEDGIPSPNPISGISSSKVSNWPARILTNGAQIRPESYTEYADLHIQYDESRPIFVRVYGSGEDIDANLDSSPAGEYTRTSCVPADGESISDDPGTARGNVQLRAGSTQIDFTHRFGQGVVSNPFQNISVGSVQHTSTGYTAITYAISRTIHSTHYQWNANWAYCNELYYWVRQELWAAVVGPAGNLVARWSLGAPDPRNGEDSTYEEKYYFLEVPEAKNSFEYSFNGAVKKASLTIILFVDGYSIIVNEVENHETHQLILEEIPYQHPNYEYMFSSYSLDYDNGELQFQINAATVDINSTITMIIDVSEKPLYQPFTLYSEIVGYVGISSSRQSRILLPHYSLEIEGLISRFGQLTVTSDGNFAIFSCRPSYVTSNRNNRILLDQDLPENVPTSLSLQYKEIKNYVVGFDLTQIEADVPKRLNDPKFLTSDNEYTDVIVVK